jgi:hypothetical protein
MMAIEDLGGLLFGMGGTGLEEYLTPQQQQGIQNQAMLQAASALLSAGGPSTRPVSLGQALGGALQAGQQGYMTAQQGAVQNLMVRQKLQEAQMARNLRSLLLGGGVAPQAAAPQAMPEAEPVSGIDLGGRGAAPNTMMGQGVYTPPQPVVAAPTAPAMQPASAGLFSRLSPEMRAIAAMSPDSALPKILEEELKRESFNILTPAQATAMGLPADATYQQNVRTGQVTPIVSAEATPTEIRLLKATNKPVTMENVMAIRRSGAVQVNMSEGQKGFENEMKLGGAFKQEPIYKDFNDMQSAFKQVQSSLKQENPIGDTAAATKIMKLLDPGSVVRESELGIAMAATGKMDRLQNYVSNWASGNKLTPTQRQDFQNLANELYAAAGQTYNAKRGEYLVFGEKYGLDANKALGAPAKLPSVMTGSGAVGGGAQGGRKPLSSIFGGQQ